MTVAVIEESQPRYRYALKKDGFYFGHAPNMLPGFTEHTVQTAQKWSTPEDAQHFLDLLTTGLEDKAMKASMVAAFLESQKQGWPHRCKDIDEVMAEAARLPFAVAQQDVTGAVIVRTST